MTFSKKEKRMTHFELKEIYDKFSSGIYRYLLKLSHSEDTAFDLMQDTFLRAARYSKENKQVENVKSWLFKIARNLFLNDMKKKSFQKQDGPQNQIEQMAQENSFIDEIHWEMLRTDIMDRLSVEKKIFNQIFILRVDHDLNIKEISFVTGISQRTIYRYFEKIKNILLKDFADLRTFAHFGGVRGMKISKEITWHVVFHVV